MKINPTVIIGIPAYNEEKNISFLLENLLGQKCEGFTIKKIIVVSDASTDSTDKIVRSFWSKKVQLIRSNKRSGQQAAQNRILSEASCDILVLIEADTLPVDRYMLQELVLPLLKEDSLAMSFGRSVPLEPFSFLERVLYESHGLKSGIFNEWRDGLNVYSTNGQAARALSCKFFNNLTWPLDAPEDSYCFLRLKKYTQPIVRVKSAVTYFRLPRSFTERFKHNAKFYSGKNFLRKYFPEEFLEAEFKVPFNIVLKHSLKVFLNSPFWIPLAICEALFMRSVNKKRKDFKKVSLQLSIS